MNAMGYFTRLSNSQNRDKKKYMMLFCAWIHLFSENVYFYEEAIYKCLTACSKQVYTSTRSSIKLSVKLYVKYFLSEFYKYVDNA